MRASQQGSHNRWCLRTPGANWYTGSQHQAAPPSLSAVRVEFTITAAYFHAPVVPQGAWKTAMKIPIPGGPLGRDRLQGNGVAQGFKAVDQAPLETLAVTLIEVMGTEVLIEALLVGY